MSKRMQSSICYDIRELVQRFSMGTVVIYLIILLATLIGSAMTEQTYKITVYPAEAKSELKDTNTTKQNSELLNILDAYSVYDSWYRPATSEVVETQYFPLLGSYRARNGWGNPLSSEVDVIGISNIRVEPTLEIKDGTILTITLTNNSGLTVNGINGTALIHIGGTVLADYRIDYRNTVMEPGESAEEYFVIYGLKGVAEWADNENLQISIPVGEVYYVE